MARMNHKPGPQNLTLIATAAITNNPPAGRSGGGLYVKHDTDPAYGVLCGAGERPRGVVYGNQLAGDHMNVVEDGEVLVKAGDTITLTGAYAPVEVGTGGTAVPLSTGSFAGLATAAAVVGDYVSVLLSGAAVDAYLSE